MADSSRHGCYVLIRHLAAASTCVAARVTRHPAHEVRAVLWSRVCNGVCNWFGHNLAQPGTTWHNRRVAEPPQARVRGTPGHDLAQRGTTWHNPPLRLRVLQGLFFSLVHAAPAACGQPRPNPAWEAELVGYSPICRWACWPLDAATLGPERTPPAPPVL
jgi:hypothetical protein